MENTNEITNGITTGVEVRRKRGLEIAVLAKIEREGEFYVVPSRTNPRPTRYKVRLDAERPTCDCQDHELRGCKCKHIYAVEYSVRWEQNGAGEHVLTENMTITKTRKTYPQDWPNYNAAQVNERRHFQELLADLCKGIDGITEEKPGRGRPAFPLSDAIFAVVSKVYSTHSGRRFVSDLCEAQEKGFISRLPHYNTIFKFIEKPEIYPILLSMIEKASLPLKDIESNFAVDSTGFAFCRFVRWYDIKYNRFSSEQQWVTGSTNAMHDSFMPVSVSVPLCNMMLGEIVFGGLGTGLYSIVMVALVGLFIAGLMTGRTPEYLGKKIGPREMKLIAIFSLITPMAILFPTALAVVSDGGLAGLTTNGGPHGFTEILYAYASCCANNGQAMAGLNANTVFYNVTTVPVMLAGRFGLAVPALALAGQFGAQGRRSQHAGTLPSDSLLFAAVAVSSAILIVLLSFVPALAMGPALEYFQLHHG